MAELNLKVPVYSRKEKYLGNAILSLHSRLIENTGAITLNIKDGEGKVHSSVSFSYRDAEYIQSFLKSFLENGKKSKG